MVKSNHANARIQHPQASGPGCHIGKGFDTIANNITIIILPVLLDLFLWLGPKLRLKTLLTPLLEQMTHQGMPVAETLPDPALRAADYWMSSSPVSTFWVPCEPSRWGSSA